MLVLRSPSCLRIPNTNSLSGKAAVVGLPCTQALLEAGRVLVGKGVASILVLDKAKKEKDK
jgi:hypothetical protein